VRRLGRRQELGGDPAACCDNRLASQPRPALIAEAFVYLYHCSSARANRTDNRHFVLIKAILGLLIVYMLPETSGIACSPMG
jgi:hypothetical protein